MQRPRLLRIRMAVAEECFVLRLVSHYLPIFPTQVKHNRVGKKQRLRENSEHIENSKHSPVFLNASGNLVTVCPFKAQISLKFSHFLS